MDNLTKRIITGIIGASLVIFLITFSEITLLIFCAIISIGMFIELVKIYNISFKQLPVIFFLLILTLLWLTYLAVNIGYINLAFQSNYYYSMLVGGFSIYSNLILFIIFSLGLVLYLFSTLNVQQFSVLITGFFYYSISWALFYKIIRDKGTEPFYLLALVIIVLIWLNDIGAYFIGKYFGKNKLSPRISPNKTIEGVIGGAVFTFTGAYIFTLFYEVKSIYIIALVVSSFGVLGDLIESKMKRELNIKDTSSLLPGHGGLLDRFDSFVFVVFILYILIQIGLI